MWGEPGTNGQHAFYQLLHQGTTLVPVDFIGFARPTDRLLGDHHDLLVANMVAQAEALAFGRTAEQVRADGGRRGARRAPDLSRATWASTMILAPELTPSVLGQLIALYEHKVAVLGFLWGINSFDQWGVELGKQLATTIADELASGRSGDHDSSTATLLARYREWRIE